MRNPNVCRHCGAKKTEGAACQNADKLCACGHKHKDHFDRRCLVCRRRCDLAKVVRKAAA